MNLIFGVCLFLTFGTVFSDFSSKIGILDNILAPDDISVLISDLLDKDDISSLQEINWDRIIISSRQTGANGLKEHSSSSKQHAPVFIIPIIAMFKSLAAKVVIVKSGALATKAFLALKGMLTTKAATAIGSKVLISLVAAKVTQVTEKLLTRWFSDQIDAKSEQIKKEWNELKEKEKDGLLSDIRNTINKSSSEDNETLISEEVKKQLAAGLVNTKLNELRKKFAETVVDKIMSDLDEEHFVKEVLSDKEIKKEIVKLI